jgi:hypothetical protein
MELDRRHTFADDEARERVRALTDYLSNKHGMQVQWTDDNTARVQGKYTVVAIDAEVKLESGRVKVAGKDPGFMWRLPAKKYIEGKLEQYLDSGKAAGELPRK